MPIDHPIATAAEVAVPAQRALAGRAAVAPARPAALAPRRDTAPNDESRLWSSLLGPPPLPAEALRSLEALVRRRNVESGELVFSHADKARHLVAVRAGDVALGLRLNDGGFHAQRVVHGPAWLDCAAAWLHGSHTADARAIGLAQVVELPREPLASLLDRNAALARRLIQALAREVQSLAAQTHELVHKDAPARLAHWLVQHSEPAPAVDGAAANSSPQAVHAWVHLRERKRDLASQLAITPETLSRLMRSFMRQGIIDVAGYTVRVYDPAALERLAGA